MTFERLCKVFLIQEPFYGIILASLRKEADPLVETLGVAPDGASFKLVYNPEFLAQFDDDSNLEFLKHECLHLCLGHPFIGIDKGWSANPATHKKYNIAADLECNSYLNKNVISPEAKLYWAEDLGFNTKEGSIYYYNNLPDPDTQNAFGVGVFGKGSQFDNHDLWPKDISKEACDIMQETVNELIVFAADTVEKSRGTIPGELVVKIKKLREKAKPVADWRRFCRRYMGNQYSYLTKKSRRRESKRFEGMMGTRHQKMSKILVAIDTSGSVTMSEYMEFMKQINTMKGVAEFHIVECDACIQYEYDFEGKPNLKLHGGGGTSFQPVVDKFIAESCVYDSLIYFTDGECPIPDNTPKHTLWVVSSKGSKENDYTKNGAKVVFIPSKQQ